MYKPFTVDILIKALQKLHLVVIITVGRNRSPLRCLSVKIPPYTDRYEHMIKLMSALLGNNLPEYKVQIIGP